MPRLTAEVMQGNYLYAEGVHLKVQDCEALRATLGHRCNSSNSERVVQTITTPTGLNTIYLSTSPG